MINPISKSSWEGKGNEKNTQEAANYSNLVNLTQKPISKTLQMSRKQNVNSNKKHLKRAKEYFEKNSFKSVEFGRDLLQDYPMIFHDDALQIYKNGVYKTDKKSSIRQLIQRTLEEKSRKYHIEEVVNWIKNETLVKDTEKVNPVDGLINVKNGLLNWKTGELQAHTSSRISTFQIPVEYNANAPTDQIERFFNSVIDDDSVETMLELFGYCLLPTTKYQKAFMFTGDGANGKSTVIELLTAFIGKENMTNISLQDLERNRFRLALILGKLVNTFADLSHKALESSSTFKSIVSGDRMSAEYKGKDAFDFDPFARLVFSANEIPTSRDVSKAFFRRWIIIPFPYSFDPSTPNSKPADPDLMLKLKTPENISGLLNLAIVALRRLDKNKEFTINQATREALENYKKDADNVVSFVEEECNKVSGTTVLTKKMYETYKNVCHDSGLHPLGKKKFNKRLQEHLPHLERKREYMGGEVWVGISLANS